MNNAAISVILPIYNAERFLHRCINSILAQTFTDFELLLIDDGSKDNSGKICDEYAAKDSRIRVFHKENGGVSSARNLGLKKAYTQWIAFVDADDYITGEYLQELLDEAINNKVDFVIQDFKFTTEDGKTIESWYNTITKTYKRDTLLALLEEQQLEMRGYSVAKLFSLNIIKTYNIEFPLNVRFGEDACFIFRYLKYVNSVSCSNVSNYCYIDHPGSAIHRKHEFVIEHEGYKCIKAAVLGFTEVRKIDAYYNNNVLPWVAHFMHRAITVIRHKSELYTFTEEDWFFFNTQFKSITRKTAIDKWMISHFNKHPLILLPYLKFNRFLREFLIRNNLWTLLDKLKQ